MTESLNGLWAGMSFEDASATEQLAYRNGGISVWKFVHRNGVPVASVYCLPFLFCIDPSWRPGRKQSEQLHPLLRRKWE